ncbi:DUF411 domain-containing protein [Vibrio aestuarianus]|uniref:DUF411 domain-containing protein n=1 Tax=Vibrio aestuarianus TaxID=28171 RepID=UPI00237CE4F1|nr:DUF411 domain-containing protein [Vibrio aestuarianus]MDE1211498.1 DUF411 domain-containing protein [Vibrio aestuarianus]
MKLKTLSMTMLTLAMASLSAQAIASATVTNYKSPYCGCCGDWSKHMEQQGFTVKEELHENMNPIKQKFGITQELTSCHTAVIDGYVFEGHVPADDIKAFLANPPQNAKGLAVPGMPIGSPGMEYGNKKDAYSVYAFNEQGQAFEFSHHAGN